MKHRSRTRTRLIRIAIIVVVLAGGFVGFRELAWPRYEQWRDHRLEKVAREEFDAGRHDSALLAARRILRDNQAYAPAWELAAQICAARGTPDAIGYQSRYVQLKNHQESKLQLLRYCVDFGAYPQGVALVEKHGSTMAEVPEFHRLAAAIYEGANLRGTALAHLRSIPADLREPATRFDLARLELTVATNGNDPAARRTMLEMAEVPEFSEQALTILTVAALRREDRAEAAEMARRLGKLGTLNDDTVLVQLQAFWLNDPAEAREVLPSRLSQAAGNPALVSRLLAFLHSHDLTDEASTWWPNLADETRKDPRVRSAMAAIAADNSRWTLLRDLTGGEDWRGLEYRRQAYRALEAQRNGRLIESEDAWTLAEIRAGEQMETTLALMRMANEWGWTTRQNNLLWRMFELRPDSEEVRERLIAWERHLGRTDQLQKIFARLVDLNPGDLRMRNNLAYTNLLLRENLRAAHQMAESLHADEPGNPYYLTTLALSRYRAGQPAEALQLLDTLSVAELANPERSILHAACLTAVKRIAAAQLLVAGIDGRANLLPEERGLLETTRTEIARAVSSDRVRTELLAWESSSAAADASGWIETLPENLRPDEVSAQMQMADRLYAMGDPGVLLKNLKEGDWGPHESLRMALVAFVGRRQGERYDRVQQSWRAAISEARSVVSMNRLVALAQAWGWSDERWDALTRAFMMDPKPGPVLQELLAHYRGADINGTAQIVRLYQALVQARPGDVESTRMLAYHRMLCGLNLSDAYVTAQRLYTAEPDTEANRVVYAFALVKQKRSEEALLLLGDLGLASRDDSTPARLVRAAALADMKRFDAAAETLAACPLRDVLPEESGWAKTLERVIARAGGAEVAAVDTGAATRP